MVLAFDPQKWCDREVATKYREFIPGVNYVFESILVSRSKPQRRYKNYFHFSSLSIISADQPFPVSSHLEHFPSLFLFKYVVQLHLFIIFIKHLACVCVYVIFIYIHIHYAYIHVYNLIYM